MGEAAQGTKRRAPVTWDESNLLANELEAEAANRTRIDEPKTPFHRLEDDGETAQPFPPPAPSAVDLLRAGGSNPPAATNGGEQQLQVGVHCLSELAATAVARRDAEATQPETSPVAPNSPESAEKRQAFDAHRRAHYQTGGLAALRARAAALDAEEEDDDDDDDPRPNGTDDVQHS